MMFRKILFLAAATTAMLLPGSATLAQSSTPCFTTASLQGTYGVIGTYGANVAIALAKRYINADGSFTGTFVVNKPVVGSATGDRAVVTGSQAGTIQINCDGTGVATRILTVGTTQTLQYDDFVVTKAEMKNGKLIATQIADAQRTPSVIIPGGIFLTRVLTRLPSADE